ncbi:MAG TPA: DUF1598 domain-containing protein [Planctomycetaceae bacterium]|nr:DUF1598 domain-containing protein [Planctomycetaceae bacterium]
MRLQHRQPAALIAGIALVLLFSLCLRTASAQIAFLASAVHGQIVVAGIDIDAEGVVTPDFAVAAGQRLSRKQLEAAAATLLSDDVNRFSPLRKVSLVRLEAACRELAGTQDATPEMQFLAGLQRIDYVFVYPETNDLVIAGPAEGFAPDADGRPVGISTGRPPLRLDDLIVALRALERGGWLGCSIDPRPEQLAALQRYVAANSGPVAQGQAVRRFREMAEVLGMQDVRVRGVPAETHFGQLLVEADYRMKRLSLALENPQIRGFRSQLELLRAQGHAIQRFWFIPLYDPFQTTEDRHAFQFAGQRAQLLSQEEYSDEAGARRAAPFTRVSTQQFAKIFTDKFPELADTLPVFAELQNVFDLAVLAALIRKERLADRVDWTMSLFLDADRLQVPTGPAPRQVGSVFNYKKARRGILVALIGGGVMIDPLRTVESAEFIVDPATRLDGRRASAQAVGRGADQPWWWD